MTLAKDTDIINNFFLFWTKICIQKNTIFFVDIGVIPRKIQKHIPFQIDIFQMQIFLKLLVKLELDNIFL